MNTLRSARISYCPEPSLIPLSVCIKRALRLQQAYRHLHHNTARKSSPERRLIQQSSPTIEPHQMSANTGRGGGRRGGRSNDPDVVISKALSYTLRHGAANEKIKMRKDGYVNVQELVSRLDRRLFDALLNTTAQPSQIQEAGFDFREVERGR